jgi:hypothetical protein
MSEEAHLLLLPLLELPSECLAHVLYHCGPASLRGALPLVCRALRAACWEDAPWRRLCDDGYGAVASWVAAAGRLRRWRCIYGALERWAPRIGGWQQFDAYPFGMLVSFRWSAAGGVDADVFDVKVGARGELVVGRARLLEVTFVQVQAGAAAPNCGDDEGICDSADRVALRLHGRVMPNSARARADARIQFSLAGAEDPDFVPQPPVSMRFVGEQHVPPDLFGPLASQQAAERSAEMMVIEWPCCEQDLPDGVTDVAVALQGGWRKHVSLPGANSEDSEADEDVVEEEEASPPQARASHPVAPHGHRQIMEAFGLSADGTWTPPVGRFDQKPEMSAGHDLRLAWLLRGIEARGPASPARSLAQRVGAFTMVLLGSALPADASASPAAPERSVLTMTLGRLPTPRPQPQVAAEVLMPLPGLYCGDYGPFYSPFNVEIIRLHYEELGGEEEDEDAADGGDGGWLCGTKVTGDMHVCMGMQSFRVRVAAGSACGEQREAGGGEDEPPVWADAAEAMRGLGMDGADAVSRYWPGLGTLAQMGGFSAHEQSGHLVLWASGQLAFCWGRGQSPVLLHQLDV